MQTSSVKFYSLGFNDSRTFIFSLLFIIGNIVLPQLCHLIHAGGLIFLPIYFFTLIGAYKYGWKVGLLTAICSPLINHFLFGMPPTAMLPSILIKSSLLAVSAAYAAHRFRTVNIPLLIGVVLIYQIVGSFIESAITGSLSLGFQDFRLGIPGMLIQIIGGYVFLKYVLGRTARN